MQRHPLPLAYIRYGVMVRTTLHVGVIAIRHQKVHSDRLKNPIRQSYLHMSSTAVASGVRTTPENTETSALSTSNISRPCGPMRSAGSGARPPRTLSVKAFAVAWRRQTSIPPDALPWILRVARNVVFELYRSETRQRLVETELRGVGCARTPGRTGRRRVGGQPGRTP